MIGLVIFGNAEEGCMVWTPEPDMLKAIVSKPALALALSMACLREPEPLSFVFVTVYVAEKQMLRLIPRRIIAIMILNILESLVSI